MMRFSLLAAGALLAAPAAAQIGSPHCFGNGCPCANDDPTAGCGNAGLDGNAATGALLSGTGSGDIWADDLKLTITGVQPGSFGLIFMGDMVAPVATSDGLRCVGAGANGLWRFPVVSAGAAGRLRLDSVVTGSLAFGGSGAIVAGSTWHFQGWYRDSSGPCGGFSNFSNALPVTFEAPGTSQPVEAEFAGRPLALYPFFEQVRALNQGEDLYASLDDTRYPWLVGVTGNLYVVADKTHGEWEADASLQDVRGVPQAWTIQAGGVAVNTLLVDAGLLNGTVSTQVGVSYDLVFDVDQDGLLGAGDLIDGLTGGAGVAIVRDTAAPGPFTVKEVLYNGGTWLLQDIYYPDNIANLGQLPLLVVSHGNGHNYRWYDHIGFHMASYGWVVMSHSNETGPGIDTASQTTLANTDHLLGNLATIAGGDLDGHVDASTIAWIGHSRGGEGIVRAYDRLFDADFVPQNYTIDDVRFLSSIAPTVFFKKNKSHPHTVNYHLWVGSADADVTGSPASPVIQSYTLFERSNGEKASVTVQGAGHGAFHAGGGSLVASGPCQMKRPKTHALMRGYMLPMFAYFVQGDRASKDFLWRQYEAFQPISSPPNKDGCVKVSLEYHPAPGSPYVIDDFESEDDPNVSSSAQAVTFTVIDLEEGVMRDGNTNLTWDPASPFNGVTRASYSNDRPHGIVFSWDQDAYLEFAVNPAHRDWTDDSWLSLRVAQQTRHPLTVAALEDLNFTITLRDSQGQTSSIVIDAYGAGIAEPYQRAGDGNGVGWSCEYETLRLRLTDFLADGSTLSLGLIEAVRLEFGPSFGSAVGRLGLDDLVLSNDK